jgi:hypothetical protein
MIGIIGLATDLVLAWIGSQLFTWKSRKKSVLSRLSAAYASSSRAKPELLQEAP